MLLDGSLGAVSPNVLMVPRWQGQSTPRRIHDRD